MKKIEIFIIIMLLLLATSSKADLVGLWHLDGDAGDSSGKGNNGVVVGTESYTSGVFGNALTLDGSSYVNCGNNSSLRPTTAVTVEAWVKYDNFFSDTGGHAVVSESSGNWASGFALYQATGSPYNRVRYFVRTNTDNIVQSPTELDTDTWYHLAMVYDGSDLTLYINGSYDSSGSATGQIDWSPIPNLYIGSTYTAGNELFAGDIDEVRIWDEALTASQIADSYALGSSQPDATVVELSEEELSPGDWVIFTSSFYGLDTTASPSLGNKEYIDIYIMSNSSVTISDTYPYALRKKVTPKKASAYGYGISPGSITPTSMQIWMVDPMDRQTQHFSLYLSTGKRVGFNAQFKTYD